MQHIGSAFIAITPEINLEEIKAKLIEEGQQYPISPAGSVLVHWKYPSEDADSDYCSVDKSEKYLITITEQTPFYAIFFCEGERYIARSLS